MLRASLRRALKPVDAAVRRAGYVRMQWRPPFGTKPEVDLAICCIFRDEARYLGEWVAFHLLQGVSRFYLYDNRSSDDWRTPLSRWLNDGTVEVTSWPQQPGQKPAYEDCLKRHENDTRWIAFLDADEFLFSPTGQPLPSILRRFSTQPAVVANWRCYGSNGWEQPPDGLVTESYPLRAPDDEPNNLFVKVIVCPRKTLGPSDSPHYFRFRHWPAVGEDGAGVWWSRREPPTVELLRVNHYYAKSEAEVAAKVARPTAWDGTVGDCGVGSWAERPPDSVRDEILAAYAPAVRAMLPVRAGAPGA